MEVASFSTEQVEMRARKIHEAYIAIICGMLVIYLATVKVGGEASVTAYISFAATLSSLILAVLAIFITLTGNSEIARNMASVSSTTTSLNVAASGLLDGAVDFKNTNHVVQEALVKLHHLTEDMGSKVYGRIERLALEIPSQTQATASNPEPSLAVEKLTGQLSTAAEFLDHASATGLIALYVAAKFADTAIPFDIVEIITVSKLTSAEYFWGFLVASAAAGLCGLKRIGGSIVLVTDISIAAEEVELALSRWTESRRVNATGDADGENASQIGETTPPGQSAADTVDEAFIRVKNYVAQRMKQVHH